MVRASNEKEIKGLADSGDFTGKFKKTLWMRSGNKRTLLVGLGKQSRLDEEAVRKVYSVVVNEMLSSKYKTFS
ncbi:MAG: hypothetical protein KKC05_02440, partial [Nanoarchaeota archaeon]|nr:hypothetical protein [Nanoarchaeota archaeon]